MPLRKLSPRTPAQRSHRHLHAGIRGCLLTGVFPRFLYAEPGAAASKISTEALWLPPAKVAGTYLAPFLARNFGLDGMQEANVEGVVPV